MNELDQELSDLVKPIRNEIATDLTNLVTGALTMALLSKQQILDKRLTLATRIVPIEEWGGEVILMELSGKARDSFEASIVQMGTNGARNLSLQNLRARLAVKSIVESDDFEIIEEYADQQVGDHIVSSVVVRRAVLKAGRVPRRMFTDVEANDLGELGAQSLQLLFDAVQELSGMTDKAVLELAGQLKNDQTADFGIN